MIGVDVEEDSDPELNEINATNYNEVFEDNEPTEDFGGSVVGDMEVYDPYMFDEEAFLNEYDYFKHFPQWFNKQAKIEAFRIRVQSKEVDYKDFYFHVADKCLPELDIMSEKVYPDWLKVPKEIRVKTYLQ